MSRNTRPGFEDIRSSSTGSQSRPEWFAEARPTAAEAARRRQAERQAQRKAPRGKKSKPAPKPTGKSQPSQRSSSQRPSSQRPSTRRPSTRRPSTQSTRPSTRGRPEPRERPRKKPMPLWQRRLLMVLVMLAMLLGTGFLAESLLFRVTTIRVTGDQVYSDEDIVKICGFKTGDNLLLLPVSDREKRLESQLPYIAEADITRKVPGTVQIEITAARGLCSIQSGADWYVVAAGGKVLEINPQPKEGLMQVLGVTPKPAKAGEVLELENGEASEVFREILDAIKRLGDGEGSAAEEFTRIDLTNLFDIRLWYQDRVECLLGSTGQLEYKITYGYGNLTDEKGIKPEESGVLDLTYLPTKKASYFTSGGVAPEVQPTADPDGNVPEVSTEPTPTPVPETGRGEGIPDSPFTG